MAWAAAIPAAISAVGSIFGNKGGGGSSAPGSISSATNTSTINFNPTLVGVAGEGVEHQAGSATSSTANPQTQSQSNPLSSLYGQYSPMPYNPLLGTVPRQPAGEHIAGNLSASTLLLIGGLGLLMVMALGGGGGRRRK